MIIISFLVVSENPRTTVVKTNDTAVYISCGINSHNIDLIIDEFYNSQATSFLLKHQISTIDCSPMTFNCSVSIPAIKENDGLLIQCVDEMCCTEFAVIHVVDGEENMLSTDAFGVLSIALFHIGIPDPPEPPAVHNINSTSLNVTWSPPWQAPVNYYVLNIVTNNADDTRNISVNGNSYIVCC